MLVNQRSRREANRLSFVSRQHREKKLTEKDNQWLFLMPTKSKATKYKIWQEEKIMKTKWKHVGNKIPLTWRPFQNRERLKIPIRDPLLKDHLFNDPKRKIPRCNKQPIKDPKINQLRPQSRRQFKEANGSLQTTDLNKSIHNSYIIPHKFKHLS